jgi:signal peptidase II
MGQSASHGEPLYRRPRRLAWWVMVLALLVGADLGLKVWAFEHVAGEPAAATAGSPIPPHEPITLLPHVLALKLTLNEGAVFGLGQGKVWLFVLVTIGAVLVIGYMLAFADRRELMLQLILVLILAGALGNFYDRIRFGAVRDMLYLFPGVHLPFGWRWPGGGGGSPLVYPWIFNLADVYLTGGVALLLARALVLARASRPTPAESADQA